MFGFITVCVNNEILSHLHCHKEFIYRQKMQMQLCTVGNPMVSD